MLLLYKIWNNFKARPDEWFFYGFLLTFPLSIRKVLVFYPINGQFNEYTGIYLYLSDVFLALTILSWLFFTLYNKIYTLSIYNNVPRGTFIISTILVLWSFMSILWSENQTLAIFRSIKLLELFLLYAYISTAILLPSNCSTWNNCNIQNVPRGTIVRNSLVIIIFIGVINSIIGIWQFITQQSAGLFWLKESLINPELPGVAKIILDGERFIRAYGLFPHPNILGGFLLFSIICAWLYQNLFHACLSGRQVEQSQSTHHKNCSTPACPVGRWNNPKAHTTKIVPRGTILTTLLLIQLIGLGLTFSKSAVLGLIITIIYIAIKIVPRGTNILNSITDFTTQNIKKILIIAIMSLVFIFIANPDTSKWLFKSLEERLIYINVSRGTIFDNAILGVGAGQFVSDMQKYIQIKLEIWQFQPVHNVFLLIWSELGTIGLIIFITILYKLFHPPRLAKTRRCKAGVEQFAYKNCSTWNKYQDDTTKNVPRGTIKITKIMSRGIILGFLFIMLFDHYLWDIQQGELLLWITFGFLVGTAFPADNLPIDK